MYQPDVDTVSKRDRKVQSCHKQQSLVPETSSHDSQLMKRLYAALNLVSGPGDSTFLCEVVIIWEVS